MGQSEALALPDYECRILDRSLRAIRAFALFCKTDQEAQQTASEVFLRQDDGEVLAGYEVWKDQYRLLVHLIHRPQDWNHPALRCRDPRHLFPRDHARQGG